jgi:hypothetical protein
MGKKGQIGESPKDRSINMMDKFIKRNTERTKHLELLPGRRKDPNIPIDLWPLKDQIEYYNTRNIDEVFRETYGSYPTWYNAVKESANMYPTSFIDLTSDKRPILQAMFDKCIWPKEAARDLQKHGVY